MDSPPLSQVLLRRDSTARRGGDGFERIVEGVLAEHGDQDVEPTVGDAADGASVGVSFCAHGGVGVSGFAVLEHAGAGPVMEGLAEAGVAAVAHEDGFLFAALMGDGSGKRI